MTDEQLARGAARIPRKARMEVFHAVAGALSGVHAAANPPTDWPEIARAVTWVLGAYLMDRKLGCPCPLHGDQPCPAWGILPEPESA